MNMIEFVDGKPYKVIFHYAEVGGYWRNGIWVSGYVRESHRTLVEVEIPNLTPGSQPIEIDR